MKISVVIPTYWTSINPAIWNQTPDAIYDHPAPIESQGTLPRLLASLRGTDIPKSTTVIVLVAVSHRALEEIAERKNRATLSSYRDHFDIKQFSASTLREIKSEDANLAKLLNFYGYSNVRNIGLAIAQILKSDLLIFLDDDVIVDDQAYFQKAQEYVGKNIEGTMLGGIAGYYTNKDGGYYLRVNRKAWWKTGWPKEEKMNDAFKIIESTQRLKETTFAFGGNMVLHWRMFEKVPFDPYITRGEDMDLLVNARLFGLRFMLDTKLKVLHLPGQVKNQWSEMRQDLYRFLYMRQKLLSQKDVRGTGYVSIRSLEPYPGYFLRVGTSFRFTASSCLNCAHAICGRSLENFKEFTRNMLHVSSAFRFADEHRLDYFAFQKKWSTYVPKIRNSRGLRSILESPS